MSALVCDCHEFRDMWKVESHGGIVSDLGTAGEVSQAMRLRNVWRYCLFCGKALKEPHVSTHNGLGTKQAE